jgi:hypothetical protein
MTEETHRKVLQTYNTLVERFVSETNRDPAVLFSQNRYMGHKPSYMVKLRGATWYPQNVSEHQAETWIIWATDEVEKEIRYYTASLPTDNQ